jgi:hypothetical protein
LTARNSPAMRGAQPCAMNIGVLPSFQAGRWPSSLNKQSLSNCTVRNRSELSSGVRAGGWPTQHHFFATFQVPVAGSVPLDFSITDQVPFDVVRSNVAASTTSRLSSGGKIVLRRHLRSVERNRLERGLVGRFARHRDSPAEASFTFFQRDLEASRTASPFPAARSRSQVVLGRRRSVGAASSRTHRDEYQNKQTNDPADPKRFNSWPDGDHGGRPRSSCVVITKDDRGRIGS